MTEEICPQHLSLALTDSRSFSTGRLMRNGLMNSNTETFSSLIKMMVPSTGSPSQVEEVTDDTE